MAGPKVTSGRDGGVKPPPDSQRDSNEDKGSHPGGGLPQGSTLSERENGREGESDRSKAMKKVVNINGGNLVDPAYREVGDGGEAGNEGNLGAEDVKRGKKGTRENKL